MKLKLSLESRRLNDNNRNIFFNKKQSWTCTAPYHTLNISMEGICYICYSSAWLAVDVGNVLDDKLIDIWTGERANALRSSVTGESSPASFYYCNHKICPFLRDKDFKGIGKEDFKHIGSADIDPVDLPIRLNLDFDLTCNFSCAMCRTHTIIDDNPRHQIIVDRIKEFLDLFHSPLEIKLNGGEPFMSKSYKQLIQHVADNLKDRQITFQIATNGSTLLANRRLLESAIKNISSFRVSFDAATKETYEHIRRGGNWENFLKNLEFLRELRAANSSFLIEADFLIQADNFRELQDYVTLADGFGFDYIRIQHLWNWNTWDRDTFDIKNVFDKNHPDHNELMDIINRLDHPKLRNLSRYKK
jgi:MoaA/NifB/PqqE/SkfB family radical SAM enzyme